MRDGDARRHHGTTGTRLRMGGTPGGLHRDRLVPLQAIYYTEAHS